MQDTAATTTTTTLLRGNRKERRAHASMNRRNNKNHTAASEKSQGDITRAYVAFKRSADERADSIKFAEFSQQRPDLNLDYEPQRWVAWYARRTAYHMQVANDLLIIDRDQEELDPDDRGPYVTEEDLMQAADETEAHEIIEPVLVPAPDNERPELLDAINEPGEGEVITEPVIVNKPRKSRAKPKADTVYVIDVEPV